MSHTPGPWIAKHTQQSIDEILDAMRQMLEKGNAQCKWVDSTIFHPDDTEPMTIAFIGNGPAGEANALLIAAAPELLAACERARNQMVAIMRALGENTQSDDVDTTNQMEAAIAKAKGQTP
jgi:hypothetical protein